MILTFPTFPAVFTLPFSLLPFAFSLLFPFCSLFPFPFSLFYPFSFLKIARAAALPAPMAAMTVAEPVTMSPPA